MGGTPDMITQKSILTFQFYEIPNMKNFAEEILPHNIFELWEWFFPLFENAKVKKGEICKPIFVLCRVTEGSR